MDRGHEETFDTQIRDTVTVEEYRDSLDLLRRLSETDVTKIANFEELSRLTRGVGAALRAIIISQKDSEARTGQTTRWESETGFGESKTEAEYRLNKPKGAGNVWLTVSKMFTPQEFVEVSVNENPPVDVNTSEPREELVRKIFHTGYGVYIFSDIPLQATGDETVDLFTLGAYETPEGQRERVGYFPLREPNNSQLQQNYARLLQQCVRDTLALELSGPTPIPPGILHSFET